MLPSARGFAVTLLLAFFCITISGRGFSTRDAAQKPDAAAQIHDVLDMQVAAWNRGDVDAFMESYWKSEETEFLGANGLVRGWNAVMARYRRNYPDRKAMGHLTFSDLEVHTLCADAAYVIGQFHLERESDHPEGIFTLNFRKFPEGWRIVADHTTAFAAASPSTPK
jgi:ketosteroid isomerase-like protein